jgi:hypothetical protein
MRRAMLLSAALAAAPAFAQQPLAIGTSPQGTLTFSLGAAYAKVLLDSANVQARVQPSSGTSAMMPLVNAGDIDAAFVNTLEVAEAFGGTGIFKGRPHGSLRMIAIMFPIKVGFFVRKDSPIRSIRDVRGRSVPYGYNTQEIIRTITDGMLANGGMTVADVKPVLVPNVVRGADEFAAGRADVGFFALGAAKVKEVDVQVGGIRFIPMDASPGAVAAMQKAVPTAYLGRAEPSPALTGVTEPVLTMFYDYVFFTNAAVPKERVYQLAKTIAEQRIALAEGFAQFRELDPARLWRKFDVPYHEGAIQYFKEKGVPLVQ